MIDRAKASRASRWVQSMTWVIALVGATAAFVMGCSDSPDPQTPVCTPADAGADKDCFTAPTGDSGASGTAGASGAAGSAGAAGTAGTGGAGGTGGASGSGGTSGT